jgi:hypothetical protein
MIIRYPAAAELRFSPMFSGRITPTLKCTFGGETSFTLEKELLPLTPT